MKNWSLQARLTFLIGLVVTLACVALTVNSIYSAREYYMILPDSASEMQPEILPSVDPFINADHVERLPEEDVDATQQFSLQGVLVMLLTIVVSVLFTYWITGKMLKPLKDLTGSIRRIDEQNLQERVELPESGGEVLQLATSFNGMMNRLEESFFVQKNFASNAAHELKTPLAIMDASLQVLELDPAPEQEDYREFMQDTRVGLNRLIKTVESLLALAGDSSENRKEPVELKKLAGQAVHDLSAQNSRGVAVSVLGDEIVVEGNRTLLYRILFNLIENAIKYNRENGSVEIRVCQEAGKACVRITDTGIGMSPETMAHAFEPFYRADCSRSQAISGSGLGLSIVKFLAERCGAGLELSSREGEGTEVRLLLP